MILFVLVGRSAVAHNEGSGVVALFQLHPLGDQSVDQGAGLVIGDEVENDDFMRVKTTQIANMSATNLKSIATCLS